MKTNATSMKDKLFDWYNTRKAQALFYKTTRTQPRKIVIGANNIYQKGWIPVEINVLNILKENDWKRYFRPGTVGAILAEHVWEHLTLGDGTKAASLCFKYLKPGGYLRIAVPDGYHKSKLYITRVSPGGVGLGSFDHKILYTYKTLSHMLESVDFTVKFLEYFDEHRRFHFRDWKKKDGFIRRSARYDTRNSVKKLTYTSLIIDAFK